MGTTVTSWPAPCRRRKSSQALYAAMPPDTPRTMRLNAPSCRSQAAGAQAGSKRASESSSTGASGSTSIIRSLPSFTSRNAMDRRLLLHSGLYQRTDVIEQALAEL